MTGNDDGFVGQSEEAAMKRIDDLLEAAAGKISASNAALKESIAGDELFQQGSRGRCCPEYDLGCAGLRLADCRP